MPKDKEDMPADLAFLPDKDSVHISKPEPYDKAPLDILLGWMKSEPMSDVEYKEVFQSNADYNVIDDFKETLRRAEAGDAKSMYEIANMYYYGFADENGQSTRNFAKAYKWFKRVSELPKSI